MKTIVRWTGKLPRLAAVCGIALALGTPAAFSTVVISYDSSVGYVSGCLSMVYSNWNLPTPTDAGGRKVWEFDSSNALMSNAINGTYSGPAIYGGFQVEEGYSISSSSGINSGLFSNSRFGILETKGNGSLSAIIAFKPDISINETMGFSSSSNITFTGSMSAHNGDLHDRIRVVVQNDGQWYISQKMTPRYDGVQYYDLKNAGTASFALFNPEDVAPLPNIPGDGNYTYSGASFQDITMVGYYINDIQRNASGTYFQMTKFEVDADVIPEPVVGALLFLGLGLLATRRRYSMGA